MHIRFSLAATVVGLMSYSEARLHRKVVLDVACTAVAEKRTTLVGVLYDEIVR